MKKKLFNVTNAIIIAYLLLLLFNWALKYYGPVAKLPSFLMFLEPFILPFILPLFLLFLLSLFLSFVFAVIVSAINKIIKGKKRFIPLLINLVMLYGLFFLPLGSWYLQNEHASLRQDRESVVMWADLQTQNENNTIVTLDLPEAYRHLTYDGTIRVFNKGQLLVIEFPYQTYTPELEDDPEAYTYDAIYYVSSDDYHDVLNYFGRSFKSQDIVKYWYLID